MAYLVAVTLLGGCGWAFRWVLTEVVKPSRDRFFAHLDVTSKAMQTLSDTLIHLNEDIKTQTDHVDAKRSEIVAKLEHVDAKLEIVHNEVTVIKHHIIGPGKRESVQ